jgi:hypothetical protein
LRGPGPASRLAPTMPRSTRAARQFERWVLQRTIDSLPRRH